MGYTVHTMMFNINKVVVATMMMLAAFASVDKVVVGEATKRRRAHHKSGKKNQATNPPTNPPTFSPTTTFSPSTTFAPSATFAPTTFSPTPAYYDYNGRAENNSGKKGGKKG